MKKLLLLLSVCSFTVGFAQVGSWPVNSNYLYFGANELNQNAEGHYGLLQDKTAGTTFLNSLAEVRFRIGNQDKMILTNSGNFGIGTTSPGSKLEVHGGAAIGQYTNGTAVIDAYNSYAYFGCNSPTNGLAVGPNGNVGIGTTSLIQKLTVSGTNSGSATGVWIENTDPGSGSFAAVQFKTAISSNVWQGFARNGNFFLGVANVADYLTIQSGSGNVGIGTSAPNQKLTVNGTIYGKEVKVDLSVPGPDYVFEKSYALPSLEEVKSYIDENKHLPEVPSAKEMEKNGINLSEMNMLLLKKVEELTLYVIELKKENESIKKRVLILEK